ncbi:unnamed protein product, partial [Phaeothamnion confervicola]
MDYKGFQNCPDFCGADGTGLATCSVCFDLEKDLKPGQYTFLWYWEFNGGDPYTSCWEATVGGAGVQPAPGPTPGVKGPTTVAPTPSPKMPETPAPIMPGGNDGDGGCFCECEHCTGCWRQCKCDAPGAVTKDPFGEGPSPGP